MSLRKLCIFLLVIFSIGELATAQSFYSRRRDRKWLFHVGGGTNLMYQVGNADFKLTPGMGVGLTRKLGSQLHLGFHLDLDRIGYKASNLEFNNSLFGASAKFRFNLIPISGSYSRRPFINAYLIAGLGINTSNPKIRIDDATVLLEEMNPPLLSRSTWLPNLHTGLGASLKANQHMDLYFETNLYSSFTNDLYVVYDPSVNNSGLPVRNTTSANRFLSFKIGLTLYLPDNFFNSLVNGIPRMRVTTVPKGMTTAWYNLSRRYQKYYDQALNQTKIPSIEMQLFPPITLVTGDNLYLRLKQNLRDTSSSQWIKSASLAYMEGNSMDSTQFEKKFIQLDTKLSTHYFSIPVTNGVITTPKIYTSTTVYDSIRKVDYIGLDSLDYQLDFTGQLLNGSSIEPSFWAKIQSGEYEELVETLKVEDEEPPTSDLWNKALLNFHFGIKENAKADLDELIEQMPFDWRYHYLMSLLALDPSKPAPESFMERILRAYALNDSLYQMRHADLRFQGFKREFKATFSNKLEPRLQPSNFQQIVKTERLKIARQLVSRKDTSSAAINFLDESFSITEDPYFHYYQAAIFRDVNNYTKALESLYFLLSLDESSLNAELKSDVNLMKNSILGRAGSDRSIMNSDQFEELERNSGTYSAIIVDHSPNADTPPNRRTTTTLKAILENKFGFDAVSILTEESNSEVVERINDLIISQKFSSNVLIVHQGPGGINPNTRRSYWAGQDTEYSQNQAPIADFINHQTLWNNLRQLPSKHLFILSSTPMTGLAINSLDQMNNNGNLLSQATGYVRMGAYLNSKSNNLISDLTAVLIALQGDVLTGKELLRELNNKAPMTTGQFVTMKENINGPVNGDYIFINREN